ncbi:hypothetical protein CDCA_CDCA05G1578 [Cyanidium caldarium]|uniref:Nitrogen fixation protein FixH n=1 Tax=Cyanidium caldarium TaxID=2771 RepID=A0AAV9ITZ9_CYACA|nr:hypothetical protein CDCA_CDCA05G1578 [Cyanidium caldarium]
MPERDAPWARWSTAARQQPFWRFGLPFLLFMVGGLYGLTFLLEGRYELDRQMKHTAREQAAAAASTPVPVSEPYENIPVPGKPGT